MSNFARLSKYICDSQSKQERVGEIRFTNFNNENLDWAIREALATQRINQRAENDKTYHLLISFAPGEQPSPEVLHDIEDRMCAAIGYGEHQRISAVHHDTDNLHIHVAINKIHPVNHTIHEPYRDYQVRSSMCAQLEQEHGLVSTNHQSRKKGGENRADDMEHHAGVESLLGWVKRECAEGLSSAKSWDEVHGIMRSHGLLLKERANGLVIVDEQGLGIKASSVSRAFSKPGLEKRLGAFVRDAREVVAPDIGKRHTGRGRESLLDWFKSECMSACGAASSWNELHQVLRNHGLTADPFKNEIRIKDGRGNEIATREVAREFGRSYLESRLGSFESDKIRYQEARARYKAEPIQEGQRGTRGRVDTTELYAQYQAEQKVSGYARSAAWVDARKRRDEAIEAAKRGGRLRRSVIKMMSGPGVNKKLLYALASKSLKAAIDKANADYLTERYADRARGSKLSWADWLQVRAKAGDDKALQALRARRSGKRRAGNTVAGKGPIKRKGAMPAKVDSVTKDGTVIHRLAGASIRDDGEALQISRGSGRYGLEAALRMALHRYGSHLSISGSAEFKERIARTAASANLKVTFDDAALERRRKQLVRTLNQEKGNDRRQHATGSGRRGSGVGAGGARSDERGRAAGAGVQRGPGRTNKSGIGEPSRRSGAPIARERLRGLPERGLAGIRGVAGSQVLLPGPVHLRDLDKRARVPAGVRRPIPRGRRGLTEAGSRPPQLARGPGEPVSSAFRRGPGASNLKAPIARRNQAKGAGGGFKPPQVSRRPAEPVSLAGRGPGATNLRGAVRAESVPATPAPKPTLKKPAVTPVGGRPPEALRRRIRTLASIPSAAGRGLVNPRATLPAAPQAKPTPEILERAAPKPIPLDKPQAADKYIAERSSKRAKGFDIPNHRRYNSLDKGTAVFAGLRQIDDENLALLKRGEEIIVLPVDVATAQRLKRLSLGDQVSLSDKGAIRKKGRSR